MKAESKIKTLGFINADKPSGLTSSAVVNKIKRLTGLPSGHMGTPRSSGERGAARGNRQRDAAVRIIFW